MEQRKPRNRKAGSKPVTRKDEVAKVADVAARSSSTETAGVSSGIKKLNPEDYDYVNSDKSQFAHLKRETQQADELEKDAKATSYSRRKVVSNWGAYEEIQDDDTSAKDFKSLLNVPISEGGHFVFKSEKNWAVEVTKYSDLFSLNVKKLARDINCIPFFEYVDVDEKYFTVDQLTRFHNLAEKSRSLPRGEDDSYISKDDYIENVISILKVEKNDNEPKIDDEVSMPTNQSEANTEEDLEFLLSLKEPVLIEQPRIAPSINPINVEEERSKTSSVPVKSIDLEKWLDSILDS